MKDFISLLFKNWKKSKPVVTMFCRIVSICLFIVFLKRIDKDNQLIISVEHILLWIRTGIYKIIPEHIFDSIYNIVNTYYAFVFKISTIIFIVISYIIIWIHDKWLRDKTFLRITFQPLLWKRMGYYKFIEFTFGTGYIYYKTIEFINFGINNISYFCEYIIASLIVISVIIYLLQILFCVPVEKE